MELTIKEWKTLLSKYENAKLPRIENCHSYRGIYQEPSFEVARNELMTAAEFSEKLDDALDGIYTGWKGGEYSYNENSVVHFADEGGTSEYQFIDKILGLLE